MSDDAITFEQLIVRRGAAFTPPGLEIDELSEGINVVFGTNASGKTTLARAIQTLIWPSVGELVDAELTGLLRAGDDHWRIDYDRGRTTIQRNGADVDDGPALPRADVRDRYYLGLHELLRARGRDFAELIATESAGGYDVRGAGDQLGYDVGRPRRRKQTRQFLEARDDWQEARDDHRQLHQASRRLEELDEQLQVARRADRRAQVLELAIEFCEADRRRRRLEERLDEFHDAISRLGGDEDETLRRLYDRRRQALDDIDHAERTIEQCQQELAASPLDDDPSDDLVIRLDNHVARLKELDRKRDSLVQQRDGSRRRRNRIQNRISEAADTEATPEIGAGDIDAIVELADGLTDVDAQLRGYELLASIVEDSTQEPETVDELETGIDLLTNWLGVAGDRVPDRIPAAAPYVAAACAVTVALLAGLLAVFVHPGAIALLVVAALPAWLAWRLYTDPAGEQTPEARKNHYRRDFDRLELQPPSSWSEDEVRDRLQQLVDRWASTTLQRRKQQLRQTLAPERDQLERQRDELLEERRQLAQRLDIELSEAPKRTAWLLSNIADFQRADDDVAALDGEIESLDRQCKKRLETIGELLESAGFEPVDDAASAAARTDTVRDEVDRLQAARDELERARDDRRRARRDRNRVDDEIDDLFERLGVDDAETVRRLCERKPEYDQLRDETIGVREKARGRRLNLEAHPEYSPELLEAEPTQLRRRLEQARDEAADRDELLDEQKELQARIDAARDSRLVRRRRARYEDRREQLRRDRKADLERAVGEVLVDYVTDQTRDLSRPAVFHRARKLFGRITRGRYRLDLRETDDGPLFRAYDTNKSRGFGLDELSSGTRLQLLFAVRLAFVRHQEQGPAVPLILDETLANSDDDRARAIIRAVEEIGADGRQILYFTAQRDEVRKWRTLGADTDVEHTFVELDQRSRPPAGPRGLDGPSTIPAPSAVPEPGESDHAGYGRRLGIEPPLRLQTPVTDVHLWYLVEDVELLYPLLDAGLHKWGQLCELADHRGLKSLRLSGSRFNEIEARARALETFLEASRIGRGRPVDRRALEESGAVSDTFIDRVTQLCRDVDGDARRLIDGLDDGRVKRFRTDKTRQLERFLDREDYLDGREPLEPREIWVRTLATVDGDRLDHRQLRELLQRATDHRFETPPDPAP